MADLMFKIGTFAFLDAWAFTDLSEGMSSGEFGHPEFAAITENEEVRALLEGAPFASWLLARLQFLSASLSDGPAQIAEPEDDEGGFTLKLLVVVVDDATPVAMLGIEADNNGVAVFSKAVSESVARNIVRNLMEELAIDPASLERCELVVGAAELGGNNEYGWDGTSLLGKSNMSPK